MTHAQCSVFVEPEYADYPEARVESLMEPYDEGRRVPKYRRPCQCIDGDRGRCNWCGGSGLTTTTYNPESKWDYWNPVQPGDSDYTDAVYAGEEWTWSLLAPEVGWMEMATLTWLGWGEDERGDWESVYWRAREHLESKGYKLVVVDYHV